MITMPAIVNPYPKVLVSFVTWNHEGSIKDAVSSVLNQTYRDLRVVVFDNNSTDRTKDILRKLEDVILNEHGDNIGFCGGHNHNILNFEFDYIFLANPDINLREDYIEKALSVFETDETIGAVCGLLLQSDDSDPLIDSAGMSILKTRRFVMNHNNEKLSTVMLQSGMVAGLDGAMPAFRGSTVRDVSINNAFFDPLFFSHKEDWDVSWRLLLLGWKTYFTKDAVAIHPRYFQPGDLKARFKIAPVIKYHAFKNQLLLLLKNEDGYNYRKDFFRINLRLFKSIVYCLFFEFRSLSAFPFVIRNRRDIGKQRRIIQLKRKITPQEFRKLYLQ